ncbi:hypothetical protein Tco_0404463 [Tanacetum coccineum]
MCPMRGARVRASKAWDAYIAGTAISSAGSPDAATRGDSASVLTNSLALSSKSQSRELLTTAARIAFGHHESWLSIIPPLSILGVWSSIVGPGCLAAAAQTLSNHTPRSGRGNVDHLPRRTKRCEYPVELERNGGRMYDWYMVLDSTYTDVVVPSLNKLFAPPRNDPQIEYSKIVPKEVNRL